MVNSHPSPELDEVFRALANERRRAIVSELASGEAPVARIAQRFAVSAPSISRHLRILEQAGLVARRREGRQQLVRLDAGRLNPAMGWLAAHGARWERSFDALARHIAAERRSETEEA